MVCGSSSCAKRIVSSIGLSGLDRQADDERAMHLDAQLLAVRHELAGHVQLDALLDAVQDLLIAGLEADEQQAQAVVAQLSSACRNPRGRGRCSSRSGSAASCAC